MEAGFGFGPDINMKFFADLEGPGLASEPLLQFGTEGRWVQIVKPQALSFGLIWMWQKRHICRPTAASL